MNEIRRIESEADEIARVRAVIDKLKLPEFITGYTVTLGEFDDEPAAWIRFSTSNTYPNSKDELMAIGKRLTDLTAVAHDHLREHFPERYPYFRFGNLQARD